MKNTKKIVYSFIIIILFSCSKYEDNTGLNLQSKNKRLIGEWELTYFKLTNVNGNEEIGIYTHSNTNIQSGYPYTQTIVFNEDGYFESEKILGDIPDTTQLTNTWSWMDGASKKEMIRITANNALAPTDTYIIKKLTKSELTLEFDYSFNFSSNNKTGLSGEFRFKKK